MATVPEVKEELEKKKAKDLQRQKDERERERQEKLKRIHARQGHRNTVAQPAA